MAEQMSYGNDYKYIPAQLVVVLESKCYQIYTVIRFKSLILKKLAELRPAVAVTDHGLPMAGELLKASLSRLVKDFNQITLPDYGKYVH